MSHRFYLSTSLAHGCGAWYLIVNRTYCTVLYAGLPLSCTPYFPSSALIQKSRMYMPYEGTSRINIRNTLVSLQTRNTATSLISDSYSRMLLSPAFMDWGQITVDACDSSTGTSCPNDLPM